MWVLYVSTQRVVRNYNEWYIHNLTAELGKEVEEINMKTAISVYSAVIQRKI